MSHQQCFEFAREEKASTNVDRRATEKEINRKLRYMQSLPDSDPNKDMLANEILQWILTR
jgi:predicted 2-oxoglutarate/Fe(II)-dependent dioxygenase YbiX